MIHWALCVFLFQCSWGSNEWYDTGYGPDVGPPPQRPDTGNDVVSPPATNLALPLPVLRLTCGKDSHNCALLSNKRARCWGGGTGLCQVRCIARAIRGELLREPHVFAIVQGSNMTYSAFPPSTDISTPDDVVQVSASW